MTSKQLFERFAMHGYTRKDAKMILQDFSDIVVECLLEGESVPIVGLGEFKVRDSKPKSMLDFQTGERRIVEAHKAAHFVTGKRLRMSLKLGQFIRRRESAADLENVG